MRTVTFVATCWESDWEILLTTNKLKNMIQRNNFNFDKKILFINNVSDIKTVIYYAQKKVDEKVIDAFYISDSYTDEVLKFFEIPIESFNGGYYYSIANLASIYLCETDYLVYFTGDTILSNNNGNWIADSIRVLENNLDVKVANPCWNFDYDTARKESTSSVDNFYLSSAFSDQCYLIRISDFKQAIYGEKHPDSSRYPSYGGECFEKRLFCWLKNNHYLRITHHQISYLHQSYPKSGLKRRVKLFLLRRFNLDLFHK